MIAAFLRGLRFLFWPEYCACGEEMFDGRCPLGTRLDDAGCPEDPR